jgi:CRISPR/Cas system-associated exonuclease Cas4 (RecB family)
MALVIRYEMKSRVHGHLVMVAHDLSAYDVWSEVMSREDADRYIREIEERADVLRRAKEGGIIPPPEKGPYCSSCPFRQACFNERLL